MMALISFQFPVFLLPWKKSRPLGNFVKSPVIEPRRQTGDYLAYTMALSIDTSMMALISFQKIWLYCLRGGLRGARDMLLGIFVKSSRFSISISRILRQIAKLGTKARWSGENLAHSFLSLRWWHWFLFKKFGSLQEPTWSQSAKLANFWRTNIIISIMALISFSKNLAWKQINVQHEITRIIILQSISYL